MKRIHLIVSVVLSFSLIFITLGCSKPKEAKIELSSHEFYIKKISDNSYSVYARGKIKNTGEVDVKKVVVTAYCRSCSNELIPGKWTVSERERAPVEMDVINYLVAGGEADFNFADVAVIYNTVPEQPEKMPDNMEVVIQSYDIVS